MLRLLWSYLTESAVAPLNKDMVEIEATCQDTSNKFEHAMRMPSIAIVD